MYVIAGLGNPGRRYEATRHNMGFDVVDVLVDRHQIPQGGIKSDAMYGKGRIGAEPVILLKPLLYMNLGGGPIRAMCDYYKIDPEAELIVLYDDIDLEPGQIRIRKKGSAGGHNGMKDIIRHLGTQGFTRVKIGVGQKPHPDYDLADWVLGKFSPQDAKTLEGLFSDILPICQLMVEGRADEAMSKYNRTGPTPPQRGEEKTL